MATSNTDTSIYVDVLDNLHYKLKCLLFVKVEDLQKCLKFRISFGGWKPDLLIDKLSVREEKLLRCSTCHGVMRDAVFYGKVSTCKMCVNVEGCDSAFDNGTARDIIKDLKIKCPFTEEGCDWTGAIETLNTHFPSCLYYPVPCPLECTVIDNNTAEPVITTLPRHDLESHVKETCPNKEINCEFCNAPIKFIKMNIHLCACKEFPLVCLYKCIDPQSSKITQLKRREMANHVDKFCPNVKLECPFKPNGCTVDYLMRKDLTTHEQECIVEHLRLMNKKLEEKDNKILSLQKQITDERKQKECQIQELKKKLNKQEKNLKTKVSTLNSRADGQDIRLNNLATLKINPNPYISPVTNPSNSTPVTNPSNSTPVTNPSNSTPVRPFEWTITNISNYLKREFILESVPFYSYNYKLVCSVRFQKQKNDIYGKINDSFGFYAHFTPGEHDDSLNWPFIGSVKFILINQNNRNDNYVKVVKSETFVNMEMFKKPTAGPNVGWGLKEFITFSNLSQEGKYRKKDNIILSFEVHSNP